jgi:hypothetical protein
MMIFKTLAELMGYINHHENIEVLEGGEVVLKNWNEDAKALEKLKNDHALATSDRKLLQGKNDDLSKEVAALTEQLDSTRDELAGLKEVISGDDKEMLQRLNASIIALKTKNAVLEKQVATIPDLKRKVEEWNSSRILEEARKAAAHYKVPQNIINDPDFETIVVSDLTIDDSGNVFVNDDCLQSAYNYIAAKQKARPHWKPKPKSDSDDNGKVSDELTAIAALFEMNLPKGESRNHHVRQPSGDDRVSDELAAIAALFE